jgi:hypothetical protein
MCAFADYQRRQLELASLLNRQIILAEVHSVSTGGNSDIDPVVYYAKDVGGSANLYKFHRNSKESVVGDVLRPQLNTVGAAGCAPVS